MNKTKSVDKMEPMNPRKLTKYQADRIASECAKKSVAYWTEKRVKKRVLDEIKNRDKSVMPGDLYNITYYFKICFEVDDRGRLVNKNRYGRF